MSIIEIMDHMDYGPAPETKADVEAWLRAHQSRFGHFIDGAFEGGENADIAVENPATGEILAHIPAADEDVVARAVAAARRAFKGWSTLSGPTRARYLYAMARHLQKRERFFAVLESLDNGKPIKESKNADVPLAIRHFYHHAGWAANVDQDFPNFAPLGVCAQIIPWNFPLLMLAWKIAPALAAGNTVVLKPADLTPLSAIAFAQMLQDIGLPRGVVNIIHGGVATGQALVAHPDVDKLAFTGSTAAGRDIRRATAGSGKALTLELGGKSPFIVCADADLDAAVEGVVDGIWFNQGEVCCAGSRILVQEGVAPRFLEKLRKRLDHIRLGDPLDKSTDMGTIISAKQKTRIETLLAQAAADGYVLEQASCALPKTGHFIAPGLIADAAPAAAISQTEIFGPIAVTMAFRTIEEAISLANNTNYGLAASVWSENINTATAIAAAVKAGVVWINGANMFDANAPFGGMKESGFGREGAREGLLSYLRLRRVNTQAAVPVALDLSAAPGQGATLSEIDLTVKNYVGGKQQRPDGGASCVLTGADNAPLAVVPISGKKDIRNAVEAAHKANHWAQNAHLRAQVLFFLAENLSVRAEEASHLVMKITGHPKAKAKAEVDACLDQLFRFAGLCDKLDGSVHATKPRHLCLSLYEPLGVVGLLPPQEAPLLGMVSMFAPLVAAGNRVVIVPSAAGLGLSALLYQLFDTSDMPGGVINLISGDQRLLGSCLAEHDAVDAVWCAGDLALQADIERLSAGNLKQVWGNGGKVIDWAKEDAMSWMRRAAQVKTIWLPYGA